MRYVVLSAVTLACLSLGAASPDPLGDTRSGAAAVASGARIALSKQLRKNSYRRDVCAGKPGRGSMTPDGRIKIVKYQRGKHQKK